MNFWTGLLIGAVLGVPLYLFVCGVVVFIWDRPQRNKDRAALKAIKENLRNPAYGIPDRRDHSP